MSDDIIPGAADDIKTIRFTLNGQEALAFTGGAYFGKFNESISLYVTCETQEQIDRLWAKLSEGGVEQPCGWVKDRFGVSWQIAPAFIQEVEEGSNRAAAERLSIALLAMKKINIAELRKAVEKE